MAEEVAVTIVMRARDDASAQIGQVGQAVNATNAHLVEGSAAYNNYVLEMQQAGATSQQIEASLRQQGVAVQNVGSQFRTALPSLATFGSSMASLLITTGALNSETGRYVTVALSLTSAAASAIPSIAALVNIFRTLNITLRATAVVQAVLLGLSGAGLPLILTGLAAGAAVAGGIALLNRQTSAVATPSAPSAAISRPISVSSAPSAAISRPISVSSAPSAAISRAVPMPTTVMPLTAAPRETTAARNQPAPVTIVNQGIMMGNETDAQFLAEEVQRRIRENERLGR